jgi:hypothetical protein
MLLWVRASHCAVLIFLSWHTNKGWETGSVSLDAYVTTMDTGHTTESSGKKKQIFNSFLYDVPRIVGLVLMKPFLWYAILMTMGLTSW